MTRKTAYVHVMSVYQVLYVKKRSTEKEIRIELV